MYYYIYLITIIFSFQLSTRNDYIDIEMKIDSVKYIYKNELALYGNLKIINKTDKKLIFPKTFDLDLILSDSLNNQITPKKTVTEEINLIRLKRRIKIFPYSEKNIKFIETRLSNFDLKNNTHYNIRYSLYNQRGINIDKVYLTNICKFKLPLLSK